MKLLFASVVVAAYCISLQANGQWGTGGGAGAYVETDTIPLSSRKLMKGAKDVLDDIHGFDDGERLPQEVGKPQMRDFSEMSDEEDGTRSFKMKKGGKGGGPTPRDDEYVDTWMPSARKGFEVPERYKQSLNVRPNQQSGGSAGDNEEDDIEEVLNERARKEMPRRSPGVETRRIDKCLRQVAKYCSFNTMDKDFAAFTQCCYDVRHYVKQSCFEWCDNHGRCAKDMTTLCAGKSPMDTTECMLSKKDAVTPDCSDSPYYKSLEEGIEEMRRDRKHAKESRESTPGGVPSSSPEEDDGPRFQSTKKRNTNRAGSPLVGRREAGDEDDYPEDDGTTDESADILSTTFNPSDEL